MINFFDPDTKKNIRYREEKKMLGKKGETQNIFYLTHQTLKQATSQECFMKTQSLFSKGNWKHRR